ncbi:MAG: amidohydrolase family protein [Planctomycetaceae bacterium]
MQIRPAVLIAFLSWAWLSAAIRAAEPVAADVVLANGLILNGGGGPAVAGSVAIKGDTIVAVGQFETSGTPYRIDCTGLVIAPGFIDLHNHSDEQIVDPKYRLNANFLTQGCTTVVTGNCGFGPVDVADYYAKIDQLGAGTNIAHLLAHGSLRGKVVGVDDRRATADELAEMRRLAGVAMQDGAWGMSSGLIYVPGAYADTDELVAISEVIAEHGGIYASHVRDEGLQLLISVNELLEIGRRAKLPVHLSHFKASGRDAWGLARQAVAVIEQARASGQVVTADQYPYVASSTSLEATLLPAWARAGGREKLLERLADAEFGPRIRTEITDALARKEDGRAIRIARYAPRPDYIGRDLVQLAEAESLSTLDLVLEIINGGGAAVVHFSMDEGEVRELMQLPWVATASDGRAELPSADKPHPRTYGTFPRKIGFYSIHEHVLPLEQAVRSATGLAADIIGLRDRGYLRTGQAADIVVFHPETFRDTATFDDPHQYAAGVEYLFVNGTLAMARGHVTGALAGKPLRKPKKG